MISIPCSDCNKQSNGWLKGYTNEEGKLCWVCEKCFKDQKQIEESYPYKNLNQINKLTKEVKVK